MLQTKFIISTKADLITTKVNDWLFETTNNDDIVDIVNVQPFMSYAGDKGYMIGCMIVYILMDDKKEEENEEGSEGTQK